MEAHQVGHVDVHGVELWAALLHLGEHVRVQDVHHIDLDAGLIRERVVDGLPVRLAIRAAAVADDEQLGVLGPGGIPVGAGLARGERGRGDACRNSADSTQERSAVDSDVCHLLPPVWLRAGVAWCSFA